MRLTCILYNVNSYVSLLYEKSDKSQKTRLSSYCYKNVAEIAFNQLSKSYSLIFIILLVKKNYVAFSDSCDIAFR